MESVIEERLQQLLDEGIDVGWFLDCSRDELRAYLGNVKAHRCRLDAVEANLILALNHFDKKTSPNARPTDNADDVAEETGESKAEANKKAHRAALFDRLPEVSKALAEGRITAGHADLLTHIPAKHHQALETDLGELLEIAAAESVDEFKETVRAWKDQAARDNGDDPHKMRHDARTCSVRKDKEGMVRVSASLAPEDGAKVSNALTQLAESATGHPEPESRPARTRREPTVVVAIGLAELQAGGDGVAFGGGPISAETVRKLACEGGIVPMVFNSDGVVLDMGRKTRLATNSQRLALQIRYGNCCAVPGCERPFEWCHIHHLDQWHRKPGRQPLAA